MKIRLVYSDTNLNSSFFLEKTKLLIISEKIGIILFFRSELTELSCKSGIYQESGPKGPDF